MAKVSGEEVLTLSEWFERAKNTLGLGEWVVNVEWTDLPEDVYARVHAAYARREATIKLGEEYLKATPESQRETLVHELLHLHFAPLDEYVADSIKTSMGPQAYVLFEAAFDLFEERAIDAIAVAVSNMGVIPAPPEEG